MKKRIGVVNGLKTMAHGGSITATFNLYQYSSNSSININFPTSYNSYSLVSVQALNYRVKASDPRINVTNIFTNFDRNGGTSGIRAYYQCNSMWAWQ